MKVLVTGGLGYKGSILCEDLLKEGYEVLCFDNIRKGYGDSVLHLVGHKNFEFRFGSVTNTPEIRRAVRESDAIIHLAAVVGAPSCDRDPGPSRSINVEGTRNILEYRKDQPLIYASTGSCYGKIDNICTEESPCTPLSLYGITKMEAEKMVMHHDNVISYRFATAFGVSPNMRVNLLVNDLVYQAVTQRALNIFQADFRRTFVHVRDISRGYIHGLRNFDTMKNQVYNFGDNSLNWTKRELAEYIKEKTGCAVSYNDVMSDPDQRDYEVSYEKLQKTGFVCQTTMEDGIDELVKAVALMNMRQYQ